MNAGAFGSELSDVLVSASLYDTANDRRLTLDRDALELSYRHSRLANEKTLICLSATLFVKRGNGELIRAKMNDFKNRRMSTQPYDMPSAGSFFKRPEGYFAAKLIDDCGLKGYRVGNAEVSQKHAGFIVNLGGATSADVLALAQQVEKVVFERYGVLLEKEVKYVEE